MSKQVIYTITDRINHNNNQMRNNIDNNQERRARLSNRATRQGDSRNTDNIANRVREGSSSINNQERKLITERRLPRTYDPENCDRNLTTYNMCIQEESLLVAKQKVLFKDNITQA